jgi:hypothetical protein
VAGEQILLDPTSEGTGTQLDITDSTLGYFLISHEYPDPDPDVVQAGSVDTEGATPAAGKHQTRTVAAVVRCVQPTGGSPSIGTIVSNLQRKVGKLFREGGTYRRVLPSGDTITFDVLQFSARVTVPADKRWVVRQAVDVTLTFTCKPYGRLAAVTTLGSHTATTKQPNVFTETGIKGDVTALASLRVTNAGTNSKAVVIWGVQSRYYDSASTAALFLEAENATASPAAANPGPTGASGGGTNKTMLCTDIGTGAAKQFTFSGLTHVGGFRLYARVQAPVTNTGIVHMEAGWTPPTTASTIHNDSVELSSFGSAAEGAWLLADLGLVNITQARLGTHSWSLTIYAGSTVATDDLYVDWVALVPVDEGFGLAKDFAIATSRGFEASDHDVFYQNTATQWIRPFFEGDYLRIPPAGAEARTLRMIVICTGADLNTDGRVFSADDLDADTAQLVSYTPRYLSVPAP